MVEPIKLAKSAAHPQAKQAVYKPISSALPPKKAPQGITHFSQKTLVITSQKYRPNTSKTAVSKPVCTNRPQSASNHLQQKTRLQPTKLKKRASRNVIGQ